MDTRRETWESFWAQKLRIDFFQEQWDVYRRAADARAEWLEHIFQLDKSRPVLSCACGEGGIELALAKRGYQVTGIDKSPTFIHHAREQAGQFNYPATFLTADLRDKSPLPGGNGTVLCFDTFGLLSLEEEQELVKKMQAALGPEGTLLIDCPRREDQVFQRLWWPLGGGHLLQESRYDKTTCVSTNEYMFIEESGERVVLADPFDKSRGDHTGVHRYIYSANELAELVRSTGLSAEPVPHQRKGYEMIIGREPGFEFEQGTLN
jgi:SAM-dependent methyltransferase